MEKRLITFAGSSKFYSELEPVYNAFKERGILGYTPSFENNETKVTVGKEKKAELTYSFFDKIRSSDILYVFNIGGYTGVSVTLEIGFAYALGKKIFATEVPTEFAVAALIAEVISPEELLARLILS